MTEKHLTKVLLLFACLSIIALSALLYSLQKTRAEYSSNTPLTINLLLQSDYALDLFDDALRNLENTLSQPESSEQELADNEKHVRFQFDVLWSSLKDFNLQFPDEIAATELSQLVNRTIDTFLSKNEPLMNPNYSLTQPDISILLGHSQQVADSIRQLGRGYFFKAVQQADVLEKQINHILNYIKLFIASLFITGGFGIGLLTNNNRRTNKLFNEARTARTELASTVDELRSGKREQKAKDSFIASASHDLRQPLHALGIFLDSLNGNVTAEGRKALTGALSCTEDLNRLFNSLLDLSRLDAGFVKVENEDFNLRKMLNKLHTELSPKARAHGIRMAVSFNGESSHAHSDPVLVDRILRNLIENAIVHSQASAINLSYDCLPEGCVVVINDNGIGIPEAEHEAIFSEYYQLQNPERDRSKGLGLGLSIVKRLTTLLDLKLSIVSGDKTGTQFKISLPRSQIQPPLGIGLKKPRPSINLSRLHGSVIVVIDDDSNIREAMHMMLTKHSINAVCGETTDGILEALAEKQLEPDFIIADYRLRDHLTGDVVIQELRKAVELPTPALIITGDTSPSRINSMNESGFDVMHKPVEAEPLYEKIIEIIERESNNNNAQPSDSQLPAN